MAKRNIDLTSTQWNDLIFEGKNKEFGAYQMRRKSDKRHNLAALFTLIGLVVVALLVWGLSAYNSWQAERDAEAKAKAEAMMQAQLAKEAEAQPEEEEVEEQKYEEEKPPEVKEEVLATVQATQIAIVDADKVKNEIMTVDERQENDNAAGQVTQEGSDDADRFHAVQTQVTVNPTAAAPEPPKIKEEPKHEPEKIFTAVEQQAQFPGGQAALMKWLSNNLRYPERAQQNDVSGRVIVKFVVNADGSIEQASVVKGVDKDLDQEALRVVRKMPKWQPGKNNGVAVRSYFTLPVTFRLQKS